MIVGPSGWRDPIARRLPRAPRRAPLVGVEQEWRVSVDGVVLDMRTVIAEMTSDLRRLDPGDRNAVRLPCGAALTADGWEAETVSPPVPYGPQAPAALRWLLATAHADLLERLRRWAGPRTVHVDGFSTHVNVEMPDAGLVDTAYQLAGRVGPALALLLEGPTGEGVLVRPRRHRLEIGADALSPAALEVAVVAVPAMALAAGSVAMQRLALLDVPLLPARERFGWLVPPQVAGQRIVECGRETTVPLREGGATTAGEVLSRAWCAARPIAVRHGLDVTAVDATVAGALPLPHDGPSRSEGDWADGSEPGQQAIALARACAMDLRPRERPWGSVEAASATWRHTAWRCRGSSEVYVVIPADHHESFLAALDSGRLDRVLGRRTARSNSVA